MSDKLGPLLYEDTQEGYLGMGMSQRTMMSDETNKLIDSEIRLLVDGAHARAVAILKDHEDKLHLLAKALLEYETLTGEEIRKLMEDGKIDRPDSPSGSSRPPMPQTITVPRAGRRFLGAGADTSAPRPLEPDRTAMSLPVKPSFSASPADRKLSFLKA
jgi:cell division protease FtsH